MLKKRFALLLYFLFCTPLWAAISPPPTAAMLLNIEGPIGPATSDYVKRGINKALEQQSHLIIIRMDTPGGLDSAMREIIKEILASPVPVVTFVSPEGARAASAGTYILYASHIAAMAPATNLGAATPVPITGPAELPAGDKPEDATPQRDAKTEKVINDAVAYIRGLAKMRNRNVEWAEKAVREAASLAADDALAANVIDLMANDTNDLLRKLHGREIEVHGDTRVLETANLMLDEYKPDWRTEFLAIITNPNIAYILMLIGIYGIIFELANPGTIISGVIGGICLLLALYAFQVLPVNFAGLALILLFAWAALLKQMDVRFFSELFDEPWFILPFLGAIGGLSISMIRGQRAVLGALRFVLLLFSRLAMPIMALFSGISCFRRIRGN